MLERWERFAPLTGVAAVVLWIVGVLVIEGVGDTPGEGGAQDVLAYFQDDEGSIYIGSLLFFLGSLLFIWFSASLRSVVAIAEAGVARLASIVFGAAVAAAIFSIAFPAPQLGGAFGANDSDEPLTPEAAQALWYAGDGFFVATEYTVALFLVATAVAIFRWRILPVWLAWISLLLAIVLLIPPIGWAGLIFAFPLWVLLVSVLLYRRPPGVPEPVVRPTTM